MIGSGKIVVLINLTIMSSASGWQASWQAFQIVGYDYSGMSIVPIGVASSGSNALRVQSLSGDVNVTTTAVISSGLGVLISGQMVQVASGGYLASGQFVSISGQAVTATVTVPITSGSVIVSGNVSVSGTVQVQSGLVSITGGIPITSGSVIISGNVGAQVSGAVIVSGNVSVSGTVQVQSGLVSVTGGSIGATVSGSVIVSGTVSVSGQTVAVFGHKYKLISGAAIVNVNSGACILHTFCVGVAGYFAIYDSLSGISTATTIFATNSGTAGNVMDFDILCLSGIVVSTSGATAVATVSYKVPI